MEDYMQKIIQWLSSVLKGVMRGPLSHELLDINIIRKFTGEDVFVVRNGELIAL
jgi:hypothetical protein